MAHCDPGYYTWHRHILNCRLEMCNVLCSNAFQCLRPDRSVDWSCSGATGRLWSGGYCAYVEAVRLVWHMLP